MNIEQRQPAQAEILNKFPLSDQQAIIHHQKVLSSLARFIGKDFDIPVKLTIPGDGWFWEAGANEIYIDPKDLLEKPIDFLRFVISHEGGHRRISRPVEVIPDDIWQQPGFSFLYNAIEDPRVNSFVADVYPRFREQMHLGYDMDEDFEQKAKADSRQRVGVIPRFQTAGFEFIRLWHMESKGEHAELSSNLPDDVREVVQKTLASARDAWLRYPSREEADQSEDLIEAYQRVSYEIIRDEVWPEFQKLVEKDLQDQQLQQVQQQGLPNDLQQEISKGEKNQTEQANELSQEAKQKIHDYINSLPEEKQKEIKEQAQKMIKEVEEKLNEKLKGKLIDTPDTKEDNKSKQSDVSQDREAGSLHHPPVDEKKIADVRKKIQEILNTDKNVYEEYRREVLPIIDKLEQDLREIFIQRRSHPWRSGFKTGKRIDIKHRIQEKAKGILPVESRAWEKRDLPHEKDYAVSILVDLSGSMTDAGKINETFKGVIVLAEVLNRLSIPNEILGFNTRLTEFLKYDEQLSSQLREQMGSMLSEVLSFRAQNTDDGWAIVQASERLAKQKATEKFLIVLSDGDPNPSEEHNWLEYDLGSVIENIGRETDQKIIGLGIGPDTTHVENYYPNNLANIPITELAEKFGDLLREVIMHYDAF